MLIASLDGTRVEAESADRSLHYCCPGCDSEVTLRRGAIKTAHFAHKARPTCGYASGESAVHMAAKLAVLREFRRRGLRAEVEYNVPTLAGDRRADVMVWSPTGRRIAIEIQHSAISLDDLYRRTHSYASAGIAVVWLPILDAKILNGGIRDAAGDVLIRGYPAPHWLRWIRGYGYGRLWIMTSDLSLWSAEMTPRKVRLSDGRELIVSKTRDLRLSGPYDLADARFQCGSRASAEIGPHRYPGGPTAQIVAQAPALSRWQSGAAA